MSEKVIDDIIDIKNHAEKVYNSFVYPLHKLGKNQRNEFLKVLKNDLENLSRILGSLLGYSAIQFSKEIESEKTLLPNDPLDIDLPEPQLESVNSHVSLPAPPETSQDLTISPNGFGEKVTITPNQIEDDGLI